MGGPDHAEPRAVIASPVDGSQFRVGVPVTLSAEPGPGDAQGGDELRWTVIRHTGTASEAVSEAVGAHATFTPSDRLGADTTYEVVLRQGLDRGRAGRQAVTIVPDTVRVTVSSDPGGVALTIGNSTAPGPRTTIEPVGRRLRISAPATSSPSGGGELIFDSWSDGGAREREYVVPDVASGVTARYRPEPASGGAAPGSDIGDALQQQGSSPQGPRIEIGDALVIRGMTPPDDAGEDDGDDASDYGLPRIDIGTAVRISGRTPARRSRVLSGRFRGHTRGARVQVAVRRAGSVSRLRWMRAGAHRTRDGWTWKLTLSRPAAAGSRVFVRVLDARGRVV